MWLYNRSLRQKGRWRCRKTSINFKKRHESLKANEKLNAKPSIISGSVIFLFICLLNWILHTRAVAKRDQTKTKGRLTRNNIKTRSGGKDRDTACKARVVPLQTPKPRKLAGGTWKTVFIWDFHKRRWGSFNLNRISHLIMRCNKIYCFIGWSWNPRLNASLERFIHEVYNAQLEEVSHCDENTGSSPHFYRSTEKFYFLRY